MADDCTFTDFRVPKIAGTHADVFAAVGLADLLELLAGDGAVMLRDDSTGWTIGLPRPLTATEIRESRVSAGYDFLKANEKVKVPPEVGVGVDYKALKAKADEYRALMQAAQAKGKGQPDRQAIEAAQLKRPSSDWRLWQVLNTLQGDDTANAVLVALQRQPQEQVAEKLAAEFAAIQRGEPSGSTLPGTLVQLFSPHAAKGYSRLKPDSTGRNDKTKEQWADPFWEWMKMRGYWRVACPYFQGSKGEHIRLLCPVPADIPIGALEAVVRELRESRISGTGAKLDALAVLRLVQILIDHSQDFYSPGQERLYDHRLIQKRPSELISGVMVTHYQSLGNAKAVSAMATLALPGWFPVNSREDADAWKAIIDEHQRILRGLEDSHSDEMGLLVKYRRFLEQHGQPAMLALLEFIEEYGSFWLRTFGGAERRHPRRFTDSLLRRIVEGMSEGMVEILEDPGFQAVATAVRRATVSAQAQRALQRQRGQPISVREIRYDLLPDLRRKRTLPTPEPFIEAVAEFVSLYNVENARRREMNPPLPAPRNVTTDEFLAFTRLIEERKDASLVGALLCAFGSCREPREPDVAGAAGDAADQTDEMASTAREEE